MARPLKNCIFEKKHSELWGSNFQSLRGKLPRLNFCLLSPFLNYLVSLTNSNREAIKYYFRQCPKEYKLFDMRLSLHIRIKHTCYPRFFHYLTNTWWQILKKQLSVNGHKCIENCCKIFALLEPSFFKHEICCQIASNLLCMFKVVHVSILRTRRATKRKSHKVKILTFASLLMRKKTVVWNKLSWKEWFDLFGLYKSLIVNINKGTPEKDQGVISLSQIKNS